MYTYISLSLSCNIWWKLPVLKPRRKDLAFVKANRYLQSPSRMRSINTLFVEMWQCLHESYNLFFKQFQYKKLDPFFIYQKKFGQISDNPLLNRQSYKDFAIGCFHCCNISWSALFKFGF